MRGHWRTWHGGVHTCFISPMVLLLWLSSMSISWELFSHPMASTGWDMLSLHQTHVDIHSHYMLPRVFTQSSVDAPVNVHRKSHSFPLIHPREVFLAWCWVITRLLSSHGMVSHGILPLGVGLTGVGLVHLSNTWQTPTHKGMPVSDTTRRSQLQCRMHDCPHWSVTSYEGMPVVIWHTTFMRLVLPPVLNLPLSLKGISLD